MAASKKVIDNAQRLRYIRALERFHKGIISYLMNTPELSQKGYDKKIDNSLKLLKRIDATDLYKEELKELESIVKKMIAYKGSDEDIENIKDAIIHSSNRLDKSKNAKRYKKDKHTKSMYDDWA